MYWVGGVPCQRFRRRTPGAAGNDRLERLVLARPDAEALTEPEFRETLLVKGEAQRQELVFALLVALAFDLPGPGPSHSGVSSELIICSPGNAVGSKAGSRGCSIPRDRNSS